MTLTNCASFHSPLPQVDQLTHTTHYISTVWDSVDNGTKVIIDYDLRKRVAIALAQEGLAQDHFNIGKFDYDITQKGRKPTIRLIAVKRGV